MANVTDAIPVASQCGDPLQRTSGTFGRLSLKKLQNSLLKHLIKIILVFVASVSVVLPWVQEQGILDQCQLCPDILNFITEVDDCTWYFSINQWQYVVLQYYI